MQNQAFNQFTSLKINMEINFALPWLNTKQCFTISMTLCKWFNDAWIQRRRICSDPYNRPVFFLLHILSQRGWGKGGVGACVKLKTFCSVGYVPCIHNDHLLLLTTMNDILDKCISGGEWCGYVCVKNAF